MFNHEPTNAAADRLRAHGGPDPWPWIVKEARDASYVLHDEVMTGSATTVAARAVALAQGGLSCPLQYPFSQISPLHLAVYRNRLDMVRMLCAHRATAPLIHARDRWHRTPLAYAAIEGHAEIAACLVEYGAPVNPTAGAVNALYVACAARGGTHDARAALVDLLLACRADTTNVVGDSLVHAALAPQDALSATLLATLVRALGPAAMHTCASGRNGKTPLHMLLAVPWTDAAAQVAALRTALRVLAVHKSPPGIDPFLVRDDLGRKPWTELVTWATAEGAPASAETLVAAVLDARVPAEQRVELRRLTGSQPVSSSAWRGLHGLSPAARRMVLHTLDQSDGASISPLTATGAVDRGNSAVRKQSATASSAGEPKGRTLKAGSAKPSPDLTSTASRSRAPSPTSASQPLLPPLSTAAAAARPPNGHSAGPVSPAAGPRSPVTAAVALVPAAISLTDTGNDAPPVPDYRITLDPTRLKLPPSLFLTARSGSSDTVSLPPRPPPSRRRRDPSPPRKSDSATRLSNFSDSATAVRPSPTGPAPPPPPLNGPLVVRIPRGKPPSPRAPGPATPSSADSRSRPELSDFDQPTSPVDDDDDSTQSDASYSPERTTWTGRPTRTSSRRSSVTTMDTRTGATDANGGRLTRARKEKEIDLVINTNDVIALLPHMDEVTSDPVWFGLVTSRHRLHFASEAATTKVTFRYLERVADPPNTPPNTVTFRVLKPTAKVTIAQLMPDVDQRIFQTRPHPASPAVEGTFRADRARVWLPNADVVYAHKTALQIAAADGTLAAAQAKGDARIMAELDKEHEEMPLAGKRGALQQNGAETGSRDGGGKRLRSASPGGVAEERPRKSGRRDDTETHVMLPSDPDRGQQMQRQQRRRHEQGPKDGEPLVID
ncbi:hypothetical protein AMAG_04929 [Allomyces macrogynus ATCC 38327]|uniref:Uncharacterized protein n=1 Tax=Allomyces macrogynus (strain ATCC 38327) TaxID=578462 RepID=A0A0L0S706_ALLM3|nr:hypothetical protein AMAG_04929 [Allomyces macrogynus ATCC 38327]|eukprot:KNE58109.1 hypothetical protein AMAG_04929 [Allomyces macrogynus ATCC 38327]